MNTKSHDIESTILFVRTSMEVLDKLLDDGEANLPDTVELMLDVMRHHIGNLQSGFESHLIEMRQSLRA